MNDNTIESIEWHKDQLAKLLSGEDNFYKVESEIDSILEKTRTKGAKDIKPRKKKTGFGDIKISQKQPSINDSMEKLVDDVKTTKSYITILKDRYKEVKTREEKNKINMKILTNETKLGHINSLIKKKQSK